MSAQRFDLTLREKELLSSARANLVALMPDGMPLTPLEVEINKIVASIEKLMGY